MPPQQFSPVMHAVIRLIGGMDIVTPTLSLPPGYARESVNFEPEVNGGYSRIAGYERVDGQPAPSAATYGTLEVALTGAIAVDDTITGGTSGATGHVIYVNGADVAYTKATGSFQVGEQLLVSAAPQATVVALSMAAGGAMLDAQIQNLAADVYRADIDAVPGSGPVRGVAHLGGVLYAWRDNVGATACEIYKTSPSGWANVPLGRRLEFTGATGQIFDGDTLTGATSGATAVVTRATLRSGTWTAAGAGTLVFASVTGVFQNGENLQVGGVTKAVASGADAANTLLAGGTYEFYAANFGGATGTKRLYGCDGVNKGFEFDGSVYVPITTGMAADMPDHVVVHKAHLFFSFGASVQYSAIGNPFAWTVVLGAGELVVIDDVTNFVVLPGDQSTGALAIFCRESTSVLYGSSSANWSLVPFQDSTGALARTAQNIADTYVLDDRGVMSLRSSQSYGNFDSSSLTQNIQPWLEQRQGSVQCSTVNRRKSQYRLFFGDGSALYITMKNRKLVGAMPMLFPVVFTCSCEAEVSGVQVIYVGDDDGYVHQLDIGTSFDGQAISASLPLVFNAIGSPRMKKRYRRASLEITGVGYAQFGFTYLLGYGTDQINQPGTRQYELPLSQVFWDEFTWDEFTWDGTSLAPAEVEVDGSAENISVQISSESDYYTAFTINSVILHYSPRRGLR